MIEFLKDKGYIVTIVEEKQYIGEGKFYLLYANRNG